MTQWKWLRDAMAGHWLPEGGQMLPACALTYADPVMHRYRSHLVGWHLMVRWWHVVYRWLRTAGLSRADAAMATALSEARKVGYIRGRQDGDREGYERGWREGGLDVVRQLREGLDRSKES